MQAYRKTTQLKPYYTVTDVILMKVNYEAN